MSEHINGDCNILRHLTERLPLRKMGPNCTKTDRVGTKRQRRGRKFGDISRYACPGSIFTANITLSREKSGGGFFAAAKNLAFELHYIDNFLSLGRLH